MNIILTLGIVLIVIIAILLIIFLLIYLAGDSLDEIEQTRRRMD